MSWSRLAGCQLVGGKDAAGLEVGIFCLRRRPGAPLGLSRRGLLSPWALSAGAAPLCDESNPLAPARTGEITLDATDFADEDGTEILSFIETQSVGKVDIEIVRAIPARSVRAVSAAPEISTRSPYYGERLKGIKVAISLTKTKAAGPDRPETASSLRQALPQYVSLLLTCGRGAGRQVRGRSGMGMRFG